MLPTFNQFMELKESNSLELAILTHFKNEKEGDILAIEEYLTELVRKTAAQINPTDVPDPDLLYDLTRKAKVKITY